MALHILLKLLKSYNMFKLTPEPCHRQTHNVKKVASDTLYQYAALGLDAVSACLVHRVARGDVGTYLLIGQGIKVNLGTLGKAFLAIL